MPSDKPYRNTCTARHRTGAMCVCLEGPPGVLFKGVGGWGVCALPKVPKSKAARGALHVTAKQHKQSKPI